MHSSVPVCGGMSKLWRKEETEMVQQSATIPSVIEIPENYRALWELCLADVWCLSSVSEWRERIDSLGEIDTTQILFMNPSTSDREELMQVFGFPTVEFPLLPTIAQVNEALPSRFGTNNLLKQSDVAAGIIARVSQELPQIVVLLIFDGLSFYDVVNWELPDATLEPCLVDGLSVTEDAMRQLIGTPVLTHLLFPLGYVLRLGFSYWERSGNPLANVLFSEFPENQLHRVVTFDEVLSIITASKWPTRTYVQIIRSGLDSISHSHRERPNIKLLLESLEQDIVSLLAILRETEKSFRLFITADHGILWHHEGIIPFPQKGFKARYTDGYVALGDNLLPLQSNDQFYTVLTGDKVIARNRKSTEWGFHGGISAQESLVPFWDVRQ